MWPFNDKKKSKRASLGVRRRKRNALRQISSSDGAFEEMMNNPMVQEMLSTDNRAEVANERAPLNALRKKYGKWSESQVLQNWQTVLSDIFKCQKVRGATVSSVDSSLGEGGLDMMDVVEVVLAFGEIFGHEIEMADDEIFSITLREVIERTFQS